MSSALRVLIVHNRYQQRGGEDVVVEHEFRVLKKNGVEVELFEVSNDAIQTPFQKIQAGMSISDSEWGYDQVARVIDKFRPTVMHVHNWFPLLSPSIYRAARQAGVRVVQSLHNYRIVCTNGLFLRDGLTCEKCLTEKSVLPALTHGCYRGSRLATLPVAHLISQHRRQNTWNEQVDQFVALTEFSKSKFVKAGIQADRITVKGNFTWGAQLEKRDGASSEAATRTSWIYVGRLSEEKGIEVLLKAWKIMGTQAPPLSIVGDGPLLDSVQKSALELQGKITVMGRLSPERVMDMISKSRALILPSICFENFPLSVIEAFSLGVPAWGSNHGGIPEIIRPGKNGGLFEPGDPSAMAKEILRAEHAAEHSSGFEKLGATALSDFQSRYGPQAGFQALMKLYLE